MEKTHIEIESNIMGKKCIVYMQSYDNLPPRITATAPCCLSRGGLSERSPRPIACWPHDCLRKIKVENVKSALFGLYLIYTDY